MKQLIIEYNTLILYPGFDNKFALTLLHKKKIKKSRYLRNHLKNILYNFWNSKWKYYDIFEISE